MHMTGCNSVVMNAVTTRAGMYTCASSLFQFFVMHLLQPAYNNLLCDTAAVVFNLQLVARYGHAAALDAPVCTNFQKLLARLCYTFCCEFWRTIITRAPFVVLAFFFWICDCLLMEYVVCTRDVCGWSLQMIAAQIPVPEWPSSSLSTHSEEFD